MIYSEKRVTRHWIFLAQDILSICIVHISHTRTLSFCQEALRFLFFQIKPTRKVWSHGYEFDLIGEDPTVGSAAIFKRTLTRKRLWTIPKNSPIWASTDYHWLPDFKASRWLNGISWRFDSYGRWLTAAEVSRNRLQSLEPLGALRRLLHLNVSHNLLIRTATIRFGSMPDPVQWIEERKYRIMCIYIYEYFTQLNKYNT